MAWVLDHLDDLASDLSAVHGIRDMTALSGPAFFKLAYRLSAYQSVIQARFAGQERDSAPQQHPRHAPSQPPGTSGPRQMVAPTRTALQADPVMSRLFSFS